MTVPLISVITPVVHGGHDFLPAAWDSLTSQKLPVGWDFEWLVQEDGTTGIPLQALPDDPRIRADRGRAGRASMARTTALGRAQGELVRGLDADDVLTDGALLRDITALAEHPECGWVVSTCLDLHEDGTTTAGPGNPPTGPLAPGLLLDAHRHHALPVVGTTLTAYTELVRIVGGWLAIPASEDVALMLACEALAAGWMIDEVSELYRKWPGQSTAQQAHWSAAEKRARDAAMISRTEALTATGWKWQPPVPIAL